MAEINAGLVQLAGGRQKDPMETLLQGLKVAQTVYGIKGDYDRSKSLEDEAAQRKTALQRSLEEEKAFNESPSVMKTYSSDYQKLYGQAPGPEMTPKMFKELGMADRLKQQQEQAFKQGESQKDRDLKAMIARITNEGKTARSPGGTPLTPGQKKVDEGFAGEYVDWNAAGGFSNVQKQLGQLEGAAKLLESPEGSEMTGASQGLAGKLGLRSFTNPEAVALKQQVHQAIGNTLKQTLGGQFTEKESERILSQAYDESLPPNVNARKIRDTLKSLQDMALAKDEASRYFEENKTLAGFKPAKNRSSAGFKSEKNKSSEKMFQVKAPNGSVVMVPQSKVNDAISAGGELVEMKAGF